MNAVEEKNEDKSGLIAGSSTVHVELTDTDGNSSVDVFNGQKCYIFAEHGNLITLGFKIPEDESGVQILLNGKESKIVSDGDEYVILSERVRMAVKKLEGKWEVYLDGTECGYFIYE